MKCGGILAGIEILLSLRVAPEKSAPQNFAFSMLMPNSSCAWLKLQPVQSTFVRPKKTALIPEKLEPEQSAFEKPAMNQRLPLKSQLTKACFLKHLLRNNKQTAEVKTLQTYWL